MDNKRLRELLQNVQNGTKSVDEASKQLSSLSGILTDFSHLDTQRPLRTGHPEVIYGAGKTSEHIIHLLKQLHGFGQAGLVTRVATEKATSICEAIPSVIWHEMARVIHLPSTNEKTIQHPGTVSVICAGTSDLPVAEEASVILSALGHTVERHTDIGVAGIHRLLGRLELIRAADVLIVVAGMEGALPSVIAGMVNQPVIAVPTSVGYGANFEGLAALLGMLNACAEGISVVNIDNGFGAAMVASRILQVRK